MKKKKNHKAKSRKRSVPRRRFFRVKRHKKIRRVRKIKKARSIEKRKKTTAKPEHNVSFVDSAIFKPKIRVIGIGGGGGSIVSEISRSIKKSSFVVADTDIRAIKKKPGIKYFCFGQAVTHGLGTGMNPELAREAVEKEKERISKLLEGQDIIILVASLGGGLGSGAAPVFAEISRDLKNVTLGIFTLPFRFEGKRKAKISQRALKGLKGHLNASIVIPNERIFRVIDENTSITEAFSLVNKNLIGSLESLIDLIYNPGLINIDFADLRTILKGQGQMAFLNTAEASGKARAEEVIKKVLSNPLFSRSIKAEKILFNISGSNNLSMLEVEKISKSIAELNPKAKIIFGISKNQKSKNKIRTTLLITGSSCVAEPKLKEKPKKKKPAIIPPKKNPIIKIKKRQTVVKTPEVKGMIRRTALEIKKAQEIEENKRLSQESKWEIPTFLRKMRFKA